MHALATDPRLRHVPAERWTRAQRIVERGWMREARALGTVAVGTCAGLTGVRVRADLATLETRCECGEAACEHGLALLMLFAAPPTRQPAPSSPQPPPQAPPPQAEPVPVPVQTPEPAPANEGLVIASDPADPGRVLLTHATLVGEDAAEPLRWLWWTRVDARTLAGEPRTLAQALQLLEKAGSAVRGRAGNGSLHLAGAGATFHQRALGDPVHVRILAAETPPALALAKLLADRGAHPYAGRLPAELWTLLDEAGFAAFWLEAWRRGAQVLPDLALNPRPLDGVEAQLDVGCLPARLRYESDALAPFVEKLLGAKPEPDAHGHVLVPSTRVVDVEEGLRALGVDVHYKRLAPAGERYLEWPPQLPEDLFGARPRLRLPFRGALEREPPGLKEGTVLASYQRDAVAFIAHHEHTCLLADDMGLGKTLEAIAAAQLLDGRVLVVCPASAREVWRREVGKFTTEASTVIGPGDPVVASDAKYTITGYSNLEAVADSLDVSRFALVILDESHYVKNAASGRAKLVKDRLSRIPRRLVISGTPVMNTPDEIRAQLAFLHPEEWSDVGWFKRRFTEPFEGGAPEVREQILARLREFLDGVMLRREKATALPDLPPKSIEWHRVALPAEARRAYVALEEEFDAFAREHGLDGAKAGGKLERLKQCALAGKIPEAVAFVRAKVAAGDKVVVFSKYRDALASLETELADLGAVSLTGDSTPEERASAETRFQTDPACRVFLGQLVAAGTALTLIAGTHAVFLDLDWNPANHRQAMDRIHRRGQTRPVTAHFFLAVDTIDEDVAMVLDAKGRMMDALLDGGEGAAPGASVKRQVGARVLARRAAPTPAPA